MPIPKSVDGLTLTDQELQDIEEENEEDMQIYSLKKRKWERAWNNAELVQEGCVGGTTGKENKMDRERVEEITRGPEEEAEGNGKEGEGRRDEEERGKKEEGTGGMTTLDSDNYSGTAGNDDDSASESDNNNEPGGNPVTVTGGGGQKGKARNKTAVEPSDVEEELEEGQKESEEEEREEARKKREKGHSKSSNSSVQLLEVAQGEVEVRSKRVLVHMATTKATRAAGEANDGLPVAAMLPRVATSSRPGVGHNIFGPKILADSE
ncbi:hypothetical protein K435DRAFT_890485 [Dendrothele bispora CBS 962.96]|uniref:Uncharacterized protein n=1 Tax=Dendrothele bispora (strain CBS 962.96) TaxID=1314807 RepID=A0A4S8M4C2_DENBC|nr:hypothetical protein K435DRAFT_890485 [Dendrothele bispora CBS 962.96]